MRYNLLVLSLFTLFLQSNAQVQHSLDSLNKELKKYLSDTSRAVIYLKIAENKALLGLDSALIYYQKALSKTQHLIERSKKNRLVHKELLKSKSVLLMRVGNIFADKGEFTKSLQYYVSSLTIRKQINYLPGVASCYHNIARVYSSTGKIELALKYAYQSLKIEEKNGDKNRLVSSLMVLSEIYNQEGEENRAISFYKRIFKLKNEVTESNLLADAYNNLGALYKIKGNKLFKRNQIDAGRKAFARAFYYYKKSWKLKEKSGIPSQNISSMVNYANLISSDTIAVSKEKIRQNNQIAIGIYSDALKICLESENLELMTITELNFGSVLFRMKDYDNGFKHTHSAMEMAKKIGNPMLIRDASLLLVEAFKHKRDYKSQLENLYLYIQMRDSINNQETQKAAFMQKVKYEFDQQKALDDAKYKAKLTRQKQQAIADEKKQDIIIASISLLFLVTGTFLFILYKRFKTSQKQNKIIQNKERETLEQKIIIEEKQKEIIDSLNYAKRIQVALLAHDEYLKENLIEHFTLFNPKDIVSGDFYWATQKKIEEKTKFYLAVCDSTGHGVPGAFMSLLNIGYLNEAINEKGIKDPNEVFDFVRKKLTDSIALEGQKDGFDGILLCIDSENNLISYAAAHNAPILIRQGEIIELPMDRMPVGLDERNEPFRLHTVEIHPGDKLYAYTDGFADQFGGPKGKKFKKRQLHDLLLDWHTLPLNEQKSNLSVAFEAWKGEMEQVDDVCIVGIQL